MNTKGLGVRKCRTTKEPLDPDDPDPPQFRTVILTVRVRASVASYYDLDELMLDLELCEGRPVWAVVDLSGRPALGPGTHTRTPELIDVETIDAAWEA